MESQTQESVAGGSPAEVPNDPGYVLSSSFVCCFFEYMILMLLVQIVSSPVFSRVMCLQVTATAVFFNSSGGYIL